MDYYKVVFIRNTDKTQGTLRYTKKISGTVNDTSIDPKTILNVT